MKTDLTIFLTLWNRRTERFDYFKQTVNAFKRHYFTQKYSYKWVVSIESKDHLLKSETEQFCVEENIQYYYKPGQPNLGSNLNFGLSKCNSDFIFYLQDDWILKKQLNFDDDIDFLKQHNDIYVLRYYIAHIKPFDSWVDKKYQVKLLDPSSGFYYYSDNPHLKKASYHHHTGPYYDKSDSAACENNMASTSKQLSNKFKIAVKDPCNYFDHIGFHSSMFEKQ